MKEGIITECNYLKKHLTCLHSNFQFLSGIFYHGKWFTEYALDTQVIERFIKNDNQKFDLIISELFVQEMMYTFAHKYKAPLALISSFDYEYLLFDTLATFSTASHIPLLAEAYNRNENLFNRLKNRIYYFFISRVRKYNYLSEMNEVLDQKFEKYLPIPTTYAIEKDVSLMMFNSLQVLDLNKPKVRGVVDIAKVALKPSLRPLPKHLLDFLESAENGVIYISFGSILKTTSMPDKLLNVFQEAFKRLKFKVLMKCESQKKLFSKNVMVSCEFIDEVYEHYLNIILDRELVAAKFHFRP
jgi:glucuronosyltransferase